MFKISLKNWKIVDDDDDEDDDDDDDDDDDMDKIHVNAIDTAGPSDQCGV